MMLFFGAYVGCTIHGLATLGAAAGGLSVLGTIGGFGLLHHVAKMLSLQRAIELRER